MKQFHSDPDNPKMPQVRYRGPNRNMRRAMPVPVTRTTEDPEPEMMLGQPEEDLANSLQTTQPTKTVIEEVQLAPVDVEVNDQRGRIQILPVIKAAPIEQRWNSYE